MSYKGWLVVILYTRCPVPRLVHMVWEQGNANEAASVCRLVLPGVRTGLTAQEEEVYMGCPRGPGKVFLAGESGTSICSQVMLLPPGAHANAAMQRTWAFPCK